MRALFPEKLTRELRPKAASLVARGELLLTRFDLVSAPLRPRLAPDRALLTERLVRLREVIDARNAAAAELRAARKRERQVAAAVILVTQRTKDALERISHALAEALWPHIPRTWRDDEPEAA